MENTLKIKKYKTESSIKNVFLKKILKYITTSIIFLCILAIFTFYILWQYGRDLPDYYYLKNYQPSSITHIYDRFGKEVKTYANEKRAYVHLSDIPPKLIHAFIAAEDKNFYEHIGIDLSGLIRALIQNTKNKKWDSSPVGGSTITQQVAKIFLVGNERSISRKIKEAILAIRLENTLSKDRILELYLNQIYLGHGSYGVSIAAKTYFDKLLSELNLQECAFLASLPKAPSQYDPFKNPNKVLQRRNWVLNRMFKNKIISKQELEKSLSSDLVVYSSKNKPEENVQYFIEEVRRDLIKNFGEKNTYSAGIEATTTLNIKLQKLLDESLKFGIEKYQKRHKWFGPIDNIDLENWQTKLKKILLPKDIDAYQAVILDQKTLKIGLVDGKKATLLRSGLATHKSFKNIKNGDVILVKQKGTNFELFQIPKVNGGAIVLDAYNGEVLAISGGYSYELSQFNCATQAMRQPASVFKPFVYLTALENGYTQYSTLIEKPVTFNSGGIPYSPHNYNKKVYGGKMSLYDGLIKSRNVFTTILADKVGIQNVINTALKLGVCDYIPNDITISLGSAETTALKLAGAFASFFNGGYIVEPTLFLNLTSHINSENFKLRKNKKVKAINDENLRQMKNMLHGVVKHGTAHKIEYLDRSPIQLYGKTGTNSNFKDAWFVCCIKLKDKDFEHPILKYKHPLIVAVFIGYPIPKSLGENETGSKVSIPVVEHLIKKMEIF